MGYAGIDIGGTKIMVAMETSNGIQTTRTETPTSLNHLVEVLHELLLPLDLCEMDGIGVGIPGVVRRDGTCWAPNAPSIDNIALSQELRCSWEVPVFVDNDAKMALRVETADPSMSDLNSVLLVAIGTGIGGAFKIHDSIVDGYRGTAGAFGWMRMHTATGWKRWEELASGRALDNEARRLGLFGGDELMAAARQGDRMSLNAVDHWIEVLGSGIASLISSFDPEFVLLTGGVTSHGTWFVQRIREVIAGATSPLTRGTRVELCRYGQEAVARGALWTIAHAVKGGG